jgi:hypothetical protein
MNIFPKTNPLFSISGRTYLSIEPGDIVDSIINIAPFSQTSKTVFTAEITYLGSNFLLELI